MTALCAAQTGGGASSIAVGDDSAMAGTAAMQPDTAEGQERGAPANGLQAADGVPSLRQRRKAQQARKPFAHEQQACMLPFNTVLHHEYMQNCTDCLN